MRQNLQALLTFKMRTMCHLPNLTGNSERRTRSDYAPLNQDDMFRVVLREQANN